MSNLPVSERTFDRVYKEDWRSLNFRSAPVPGKDFRSYTWRCSLCLDQGREGACVGFGCTHDAIARPVVIDMPVDVATQFAFEVYREAQKIDPWPGEFPAYEGTSVLAGVKIMQARGLISEYRWCLTMGDLAFTVGYRGPVIIGVDWYSGMGDVDSKGFIHAEGQVLGGHCLLLNGVKIVKRADGSVDTDRCYFRLHNSWGADWGINGECFISWNDMKKLMDSQGDFCIPTIRKPGTGG